MTALSKKQKVTMALILSALALFVGTISFTEICSIEAVTLNGQNVSDWYDKSPLKTNRSIMRQPLDKFVEQSLGNEQTLKVNIRYSWPHTLRVELNSISPDCLILDRDKGTLYGLDENCRVIPLKESLVDWERPLFTGIKVGRLYDFCPDLRSREVLAALDKTKRERINFYRLIEQVDFSSRDYLEVTLAGHSHTIRLRSQFFYEDVNRYVDFAARYNLELDSVKVIDLRQSGQIVAKGRKG